jgi:hypothetical protein
VVDFNLNIIYFLHSVYLVFLKPINKDLAVLVQKRTGRNRGWETPLRHGDMGTWISWRARLPRRPRGFWERLGGLFQLVELLLLLLPEVSSVLAAPVSLELLRQSSISLICQKKKLVLRRALNLQSRW